MYILTTHLVFDHSSAKLFILHQPRLFDYCAQVINSFTPQKKRKIAVTTKKILEILHHRLSKFDRSVFLILKPISYFLAFIWIFCTSWA